MIVIVANSSPLIPHQFPAVYKSHGPTFVEFVRCYFAWMEQTNNAVYWSRKLYELHDIDTVPDEFIIHFKQKYLNNIQFSTEADLTLLIKHATDIYRSKGTERCVKLIFQAAFDEIPQFYYPSTDLFKLSDGTWFIPQYLELTLAGSPNNIALQQKEITGVTSGAIAFVDNIIRRKDNNKFSDVAFISAIQGEFLQGETIIPTDGSLEIENCPAIVGSMDEILIPNFGTGLNYSVGDVIPIVSLNGVGGLIRVSNTETVTGIIGLGFLDGGYGYSFNQTSANLTYSSANGLFLAGDDLWSFYPNNAISGISLITSVSGNSSAGVLTVDLLSGLLPNGAVYSYANGIGATVSTVVSSNNGPVVYISNSSLFLGDLVMNSANLEQSHYFNFGDFLVQPMVTVGYSGANGVFLPGQNVATYYPNGELQGTGVILAVNQLTTNTGSVIINCFTGNTLNWANDFYTSAGSRGVVPGSGNTVANTTASGQFIANSDVLTIAVSNVAGTFFVGENIFQSSPIPGPVLDQKDEGFGVISGIAGNYITVSTVVGRFIAAGVAGIVGGVSQASATVVSANVVVGVVNVTNSFFPAAYSYFYSPIMTGSILQALPSGTGFSVTIPAAASNPEQVLVNVDYLESYANVMLNANSYGFPLAPGANATSGTINSTMNMMGLTIGSLANAYIAGTGINFETSPFIVIDDAWISDQQIGNDILKISGANSNFLVGEVIYQGNSSVWIARGELLPASNGDYLWIERQSYANDFVITSNSTTVIVGTMSGAMANVVSVDYDPLSQYMGRNAVVVAEFQNGNGCISNAQVIASGYGFANGETVLIGSNGAAGVVSLGGMGTASGYYSVEGGFLSDVKKLFDGYFYQNFSYQIISDLMVDRYYNMMMELSHPAGTIMFGDYVHTSVPETGLRFQTTAIAIGVSAGATYNVSFVHAASSHDISPTTTHSKTKKLLATVKAAHK